MILVYPEDFPPQRSNIMITGRAAELITIGLDLFNCRTAADQRARSEKLLALLPVRAG